MKFKPLQLLLEVFSFLILRPFLMPLSLMMSSIQYKPMRTCVPVDVIWFLSSLASIIAVSYEARAHGVGRNMWVDDAKTLCPDLQVARVRESHGKADLTQ